MHFGKKAFNMLERIKERPGLIGGKSIKALSIYFAGYTCACSDLIGVPFRFDCYFQSFIEERYEPYNGIFHNEHWADILQHYFPDEKAFDVFFEELKLFKEVVSIGPDSGLYKTTGIPRRRDRLAEIIRQETEPLKKVEDV